MNREHTPEASGPAELRPFLPRFDILYAGLPETSPEVLESIGPLGWALRAVQRVEADQPEFVAVLERAAQAFRPVLRDEWRELVTFLFLLITHRRPKEEFENLQQVLQAATVDGGSREELKAMGKTMAEVWVEEGFEKGLEQGREAGRQEGREEGRLDAARQIILSIGRSQLGEPSPGQRARLDSVTDLTRLEALAESIVGAGGWDSLLKDL